MIGFAVYYLENGQIVDDLMLTSNYGALKQMGVTFTPPLTSPVDTTVADKI
jgi:hypothetical protein